METVPAGGSATFANLLPLANADRPGIDRTASTGWTVQAGYVGTPGTYCSVIAQSAPSSGEITIVFF
jgi:hypothetical protein